MRLDYTSEDRHLDIFLVSPGTALVVELSTDNGAGSNYGSGSNDCSGTPTRFDDSAATAITDGSAPFAGPFRPEGSLAGLNGRSTSGFWRLRGEQLRHLLNRGHGWLLQAPDQALGVGAMRTCMWLSWLTSGVTTSAGPVSGRFGPT